MSFGKLKTYTFSTLSVTTKNSIVIIKCGNFNKITPLNSPNAFFFIYSFKAIPSYTTLCQAYFSDKQFYLKLVNNINIHSSMKRKLKLYMMVNRKSNSLYAINLKVFYIIELINVCDSSYLNFYHSIVD